MEDIKFTIGTVAFNGEKNIAKAIESVLGQTYINYEYIIMDGVSTDRTVEIAESYRDKFEEKGLKYTIVSEKDNGMYDAMNKIIGMATGELIGMVNSDDFYELDCLENVANEYKVKPFDLSFGDLRIFDEKGSFIKTAALGKKFQKRHWNHPTMFVSPKVYAERKYACESMFDDLDFMLWCVSQKKFDIRVINKTLSNFQLGGMSSKRSWKNSMARVKLANHVYKKNNIKGHSLENFLIEVLKFLRG